MNKQELVKEITNRVEGATQKDVVCIIDTFAEVVKETVANGDKVNLVGFMTASKKHVPAKSGKTKLGGVEKPWTTEAKDEVSIKLSKTYKAL